MAAAIPSIGSPASSHAVARRTFCTSVSRNGPTPSPGHQDAEIDQPLDLGLRHAGEVGKFGCRQPIHAATIL
jgi:hypothetical protein